jgi:uncharacterized protein (TIGR00156 family)
MTISTRSATFARSFFAAAALSGALLATGAQAQGYTGPSTVPVMTVKSLTETGRDDQHAVLRGRIVSHNGGDEYTFEDETGRIRVDIDNKKFPTDVAINEKTQVELRGELERKRHDVEFDVSSIKVM